jgi:hypothetical protein
LFHEAEHSRIKLERLFLVFDRYRRDFDFHPDRRVAGVGCAPKFRFAGPNPAII